MMFSLAQLRTFLEVDHTGSLGDAADRLVVSQPAASSALASLQRAVGAPVVRTRTAYGARRFVEHAVRSGASRAA